MSTDSSNQHFTPPRKAKPIDPVQRFGISEQGYGFSVGGTTTLEGGTFISGAANCGGVYVQAVVIKDGGLTIPASEYEVSYSDNVNVGTATVTITNKTGGNYTVSGTKTFTITAKPLTGAKVEVTGTFTYTGSALTPAPTVTLGGQTLVKDTDYTVAYADNTDAGTATITVTGKGN